MSDIESQLSYNRETLVAMALLIGCDYDDGVKSVAKEKTLKLMRELCQDGNVLQRIQGWRANEELTEIASFKDMTKPAHCTHCGHEGGWF